MRQIINGIFCGFLCLIFSVSSVQAQIAIDISGANGGGIKLGGSGGCDEDLQGTLRYDSGNCFQICNGEYWECVEGDCDADVHPFSFTDVSGASTSTLYTSNIVQIDGADAGCLMQIYVGGNDSPEWRSCSDATCTTEIYSWRTSWSGHHSPQGNYVQVRVTSPASTDVVEEITLNVGDTQTVWTVGTTITGSCGASPNPGDICPDGTIYVGISPDGQKPMYLARCDIGMSWSGSACTGTRSLLPWNNDNSSDYTATGYTSNTDGDGNTAGIITVDSDSGTAGVQPHQAAQACTDLNVHGHTDWYLPAVYEMWVIWDNVLEGPPDDNIPQPLVNGFATMSYWTSSEGNSTFADFANLSTGNGGSWYGTAKRDDLPVRCARLD